LLYETELLEQFGAVSSEQRQCKHDNNNKNANLINFAEVTFVVAGRSSFFDQVKKTANSIRIAHRRVHVQNRILVSCLGTLTFAPTSFGFGSFIGCHLANKYSRRSWRDPTEWSILIVSA
jgi:hypothetical protein